MACAWLPSSPRPVPPTAARPALPKQAVRAHLRKDNQTRRPRFLLTHIKPTKASEWLGQGGLELAGTTLHVSVQRHPIRSLKSATGVFTPQTWANTTAQGFSPPSPGQGLSICQRSAVGLTAGRGLFPALPPQQ